MDPYLVIKYNGAQQRSKVVNSGHINPKWENEVHDFTIQNPHEPAGEIKFDVLDKDPLRSVLIGSGVL